MGGESRWLWSQFNRSILGSATGGGRLVGDQETCVILALYNEKSRRKSCRSNTVHMDTPTTCTPTRTVRWLRDMLASKSHVMNVARVCQLGLVVDVRKRIPSCQTHGGGGGRERVRLDGVSYHCGCIIVPKIACGAGGLGRRGS